MRNTEAEFTAILEKIFTYPEVPECDLPTRFKALIKKAQDSGLENIPPVVIENEMWYANGRLDMATYGKPVIVIAQNVRNSDDWTQSRTVAGMTRTLAHELGHWEHVSQKGLHYGNAGFKACEDYADDYRDRILQ